MFSKKRHVMAESLPTVNEVDTTKKERLLVVDERFRKEIET